MKIAVLVDSFPVRSEPFVANRIQGLRERGVELDVISISAPDASDERILNLGPDLRDRTEYVIERNNQSRHLAILYAMLYCVLFHPVYLSLLLTRINPLREYRTLVRCLLLLTRYPPGSLNRYDHFFCQFGLPGKAASTLRSIGWTDTNIVTAYYGYDLSTFLKQNGQTTYDLHFRVSDVHLPVSAFFKQRLISMGCPEDSIVVHRMGIDVDQFRFHERKKTNPVQFLSVARFVEKKGLEYAIRAVITLLDQEVNVRYKLAGDGPLKNRLRSIIQRSSCCDQIELLGWKDRSDVRDLMHNSDVFLAPSVTARNGDVEGIPNAITEAMATGMPVVSTYHSGIPELIQDGKNGYLVEERDTKQLTHKLQTVIRQGDRWPEIGRRARSAIEQNYHLETQNDRLKTLLSKVCVS